VSVTRNHDCGTRAEVLDVGKVSVLSTDEDIRAPSGAVGRRDQLPRRRPGVIVGYERNVATNTMLRKHGIE